MECYFREHMAERDLLFHDTDEDLTLKDLEMLQRSSDLDSIYPGHCFLNLVTLSRLNDKAAKSYILVTPHPGRRTRSAPTVVTRKPEAHAW
jgi:hypothetical protein